MKSFYLTDPGKVRTHNEDSVTIVKNSSEEFLMIVADGMGGHRAGEVASSMVVTHIGSRFSELGSIGSKLDAVNWLNANVNEINTNIIKYTEENANTSGMGTTVVMALLTSEFLIFANIGDSSGFVLKGDKLHKVTRDHTLVNLLVDSGEISAEEGDNHPKKNVLMKALGASDKQELDIFDVDLNVSAVLLASDGLTNMITKDQIEKVLLEEDINEEAKLIKLIKKCNSRGGTDNISIAYLVKESGETE